MSTAPSKTVRNPIKLTSMVQNDLLNGNGKIIVDTNFHYHDLGRRNSVNR